MASKVYKCRCAGWAMGFTTGYLSLTVDIPTTQASNLTGKNLEIRVLPPRKSPPAGKAKKAAPWPLPPPMNCRKPASVGGRRRSKK